MKKLTILSILSLVVAINCPASEHSNLKLAEKLTKECVEFNAHTDKFSSNSQPLEFALKAYAEPTNNGGLAVMMQTNARAL
ncbi:hypothetical protein [Thalassomonas sp. M1454]|uniref:hypothetical protein n=1 Tax=Thalassomonas sp. M1454 TaxID=2594477 RepID=UPI00117FD5A1|nr:hypothetical protein [Thalassomonas sp. M1454]TRX54489.1 hypothetical protein FNN08_12215 [Thalassomonas sp. M1454]